MVAVITENLDLWSSAMHNKSTAGRGISDKQTAYGIKKLRELILELAVRGKLITQDPNDEPARTLLDKIDLQKTRLIDEGKLKPQKCLPEISEEEMPPHLPTGWELVRLGKIINVLNGRAYKKHEMLQEGTPLLRVGNLFTSNEWYYSDLELEPDKYIDNGDLIYAWSASFGPFIWQGGKAIYHYHIWKLDLYDPSCLDKQFLFYFFTSITEKIKASGNGIAMIHMTKERMEKLILEIPPLTEQHRIVAKVDELMALCDQLEQQQTDSIAAHQTLVQTLLDTLTQAADAAKFEQAWSRITDHFDTLFTTVPSIDQLKQTLLQLAVMGKLVPQDSYDEPANVLLEKIAAEKAQLIESGKIKKQSLLAKVTDEEKIFPLPKNWVWARLQDVVDVRDGTHDSPKDAFGPNTYPLVTSKNFNNGDIDFEGARRISAEDHFEISKRSLVEKFDILFSMIGGNLGNQVMVKDDREFSVKNVALFKYYSKELTSPFFVKKYMEHLALDLQEKAIGGAQPFVSLGFLRNLVFALPPINEQQRIVAKVDELMALCDSLKARIAAAQTTQVQLADAIVEQAVA
ncbi:restriction endonuclease subunit S [Methylomonas sp. LW13]|uniref:restriction endonuclease subunit S n=1 Tax=unclassified Methylomonas TaxID=2608980 RepID=UPI00068AAD19|nr:restriction endonuclease subunit S [Methylomonas sp. LW13]QBC25966.1 restriction endonuclease subunit S [Methylomonas sp. LW13]